MADAVRERRLELGLTQEDIRAAGGPSTATMRLIEGALQDNYQPAILRRLEDVLGWKRGSIQRVHDGHEPVLAEQTPGPPPAERPPAAPGADAHAAAVALLEEISRLPVGEQRWLAHTLTGRLLAVRDDVDWHDARQA